MLDRIDGYPKHMIALFNRKQPNSPQRKRLEAPEGDAERPAVEGK